MSNHISKDKVKLIKSLLELSIIYNNGFCSKVSYNIDLSLSQSCCYIISCPESRCSSAENVLDILQHAVPDIELSELI